MALQRNTRWLDGSATNPNPIYCLFYTCRSSVHFHGLPLWDKPIEYRNGEHVPSRFLVTNGQGQLRMKEAEFVCKRLYSFESFPFAELRPLSIYL